MVRDAIETYLTTQPQRKDRPNELYVSELGYHPNKFMRRVLHGETETFALPILDVMQQGSTLEDDTAAALRYVHPNVLTQFPLHNDIWSGYADIVIGHGTNEVTIIEHKCTGEKWFDFKESLPRSNHVCQLWLYGWLYEQMFGIQPKLILYYKSWGAFAEFQLPDQATANGQIVLRGVVGQKQRGAGFVVGSVLRSRHIAPNLLRLEAEHLFNNVEELAVSTIDPETWNYPEEAYAHLVENLGVEEPIW